MGVVYSMRKMKLDLQFFAASATYTGEYVVGNYSWAKIQGRVICEETYVGTSNENKSSIKCTVQARVTTGGTQAANWRASVTCNGVTKTGKTASNTTISDSWVTITTFTFENIAHNEDGTKKVAISGYAQAPEYPTSLGDAKSSFNGEMELTTIPRASTLDSFSGSKRIGVANDVIINFTKKSSKFTTTLEYATTSNFSDAVKIVDKSTNASTYSWTLPIGLLNKIPNSKSLTIYIRLTTYDSDTQIGNAQTSSFTASVYEDNCRPVWNTHTIEETDTTAKQLVTTANKFIANLSKPKFTFSATGQYGATISYYQINNTTRTSGFTDSSFNTNGYVLKVVDSRGVTNTYTFTTTYVPYFTPIFEEVKLFRDVPTSNKVFSYFKIKFFNNTSDVKFDNPQALSYKFNYQEAGGTAQEILITPETYDIETSRYAENETELGSSFNYKKSVDWTFSFVDLTGKTFTTNTTLPMGIPLMNGKMNADGEQELYINGNTNELYSNSASMRSLPNGNDSVEYWRDLPNGTYWYANTGAVPNIPSSWGFVIKDGIVGGDFTVMFHTQASGPIYRKSGNYNSITGWVQQLDSSNLINLIYPVGSIYMSTKDVSPQTFLGGTWVRLQDRFLLGASSTYAVNSKGGSKDAIVVSHTHTMQSAGSHTHNIGRDRDCASGSANWSVHTAGTSGAGATSPTSSAGGHTHTIDTTGTSGTNANMPPYLAVYMWERTA